MASPSVDAAPTTSRSGDAPGGAEPERHLRRGAAWIWLGLLGMLLLIAAFIARGHGASELRLRNPVEAPPGVLPTQDGHLDGK